MAHLSMDDPLFPNDPSPSDRELDAQDIRSLARAVLGRAFTDLQGTSDYGKFRKSKIPGISGATTAMRMGEEVRAWFRSDQYYVFSFRMCCELSGYDYKKIRRGIIKYMVPKNAVMADALDTTDDLVVEYIKQNQGVSNSGLVRAFRGKQHPTILRHSLKRIRLTKRAFTRTAKGTGVGSGSRYSKRWFTYE